ncbi:SOS response-associated peptidase [Methylovirgula sp. 4M-Z18]|uniref:SOS response-associated peptidase n=1 Tax=Methylovirgula sp. 4M-Z18 TaxID=2293567 RepID=UPI000E2FDB7F|nr:SOS response-associated peptidase [Methylovirgula sp. 4M-Z18]RFB80091.1 SOS response-associated peptidase [Methylovirgula sp. 4M-Z18]
MCGRFNIVSAPSLMREHFGYAETPNFPPRYNVAPTQPVPVVRRERDAEGRVGRHFVLMRWGFLPSWVKDPKDFPLLINARAETVTDKASFRAAFQRRRCLMIADGFYEWRRVAGARGKAAATPFLIRRKDREPLALGALWENWLGADGSEIETCCVVTTAANGTTAAIHDRMPVILAREDYEAWLNPDVPVSQAMQLTHPAADDLLDLTEISSRVNKVANDDAGVMEPVRNEPPEPQRTLF